MFRPLFSAPRAGRPSIRHLGNHPSSPFTHLDSLLRSKPSQSTNVSRKLHSGRTHSHPRSSTKPNSRQWRFWNSSNNSSTRRRSFFSSAFAPPVIPGSGKTVAAAVSAVGLTGSVSYYYDELESMISHLYISSERSTRIAVAAATCFDDYRRVLGKTYASEDERAAALSACHQRCADRTYKVLEACAGIYIKIGQHLSAMTYLLPPEWTSTFIPLQDRCPVSSIESIREMFSKDTGLQIEDVFSEFDETPIGIASLAQVHTATLKETGERVAVKFQHPALAEFIPLDLKLTQLVFSAIDRFFPEYPTMWLYHELDQSIFVELDFTQEAKNAVRTQKYFKKLKGETAMRVPNIIWSKPRILVMEYVTGARPDNLEYLDKHNISRNQVSICLSHIFNTMIFTPDVRIHCDPHGGNLAIRALPESERPPWYSLRRYREHNFEIVLYDHGLYRDVPLALRRSYSRFWLAVIDSDVARMRQYAKEFAGITDAQFPLFASAITGRDFTSATTSIMSRRSREEMQRMALAIQGGLLPNLIQLLAGVPSIVLLILKTNDLTRALDEGLHTSLGPERTFLIMASYCARTVLDEEKEKISELKVAAPVRFTKLIGAYARFYRRQFKVQFYDIALWFSGIFNL
ncbi:ABC1 family-domain-containing protein [Myxozyma melibiosi]|uniref:ABC1 family-domain-containing protein n=1 Tax=Myxozyma melibiosi TaxID=54550 RepID=A0ABR1F1Q7_9ASCO